MSAKARASQLAQGLPHSSTRNSVNRAQILRALREGNWTYAVYFGLDGSGIEYELYDLKTDSLQMNNLLHGSPASEVRSEWARLHDMLTRKLVEVANLPLGFPWPLAPAA